MLIRSPNNPFEAVVDVGLTPGISPHIVTSTLHSYAKAVHQDYGSLVTPSSPARPGEIVHLYLTGLGPLDQAVPTGAPGPSAPLAHPLAALNCSLGVPFSPLQMPGLFYAPAMIGIYQAELIIPDNAPDGTSTLYCSTSDASGMLITAAPLSTTSAR